MFRIIWRRASTPIRTQVTVNKDGNTRVSRACVDSLIKGSLRDRSGISQDISPESVVESLGMEFPTLAPEYLLCPHSTQLPTASMSVLQLLVVDNIDAVSSPNVLLRLGEYAARNSAKIEYGLLDACVRRSAQLLSSFTAGEFIGLLSLCARLDFVDSDFNEAVQVYIPSMLTQFKDTQYPVLFAAIFRLGIEQPIDREYPETSSTRTLPFMVDLIGEIIRRLPNISESGCLTMLHSILRKPKSRTTSETLELVQAISDQAQIGSWPLHMRVQVMHSLSRFGVDTKPAIESLFSSITRESIQTVPPQNLQHLLSLLHNHAKYHDEKIWRPVLEMCLDRLSQPVIAKTMPMAIIAVTMSYLGRLGLIDKNLKRGFGNLLSAFLTGQTRLPKILDPSITGRISDKMVRRILTDSLVDIAHLTGIVEAIDRLGYWDMYYASPLLFITRRFMLREGIHNIRAAPLCQLALAILNSGCGELTLKEFHAIDALIDSHIASVSLGSNWSLINEAVVAPSCNDTVALLLEGLLKHESYIRTTQSVLDRCVQIRSHSNFRTNDRIPKNVVAFLDSLPEMAEQIVDPV